MDKWRKRERCSLKTQDFFKSTPAGFSRRVVAHASRNSDEKCHTARAVRGEERKEKKKKENTGRGQEKRAKRGYLASRVSTDYKVYPFTGWEVPEETDDARGVICTQKREARPRVTRHVHLGGKGGKGEKPDDEVRVEKRAERVFTGDTRFESFANTPAMKMERRSRIRNWKSNEHFQCSMSIDGIETLIRLICRKARVFPTFDWKRTNEKVKKVSRGE